MSMTFSGQVALVTGGAAGIGRATALAFAREGLKVVVADLDEAGGEVTAMRIREAGGEALFVACDVTQDAQVRHLHARTIEAFGRLDYAYNNAGIEIEQGRLAEGSEAEFDAIMGVNVKGVWLCMKYQLPLLLAQGGGGDRQHGVGGGLGGSAEDEHLQRIQACGDRPDQVGGHRVCEEGHSGECGVPRRDRHRYVPPRLRGRPAQGGVCSGDAPGGAHRQGRGNRQRGVVPVQ